MMKETVPAIESTGFKVFTFAPSAATFALVSLNWQRVPPRGHGENLRAVWRWVWKACRQPISR